MDRCKRQSLKVIKDPEEQEELSMLRKIISNLERQLGTVPRGSRTDDFHTY